MLFSTTAFLTIPAIALLAVASPMKPSEPLALVDHDDPDFKLAFQNMTVDYSFFDEQYEAGNHLMKRDKALNTQSPTWNDYTGSIVCNKGTYHDWEYALTNAIIEPGCHDAKDA
ncbi:hypothetical protein K402DRAFT_419864 [Aulographum hederae CBS 113979]|uniref:Uncharacterized protein n=1 Tax=Aulographum hederae CBS 113979 TaxID=1176131 RepID=A0A6G1H473_9PEZI|nr:hypothetical protein K402DRAFT_419864 [Aulographum hederae CBS 113979]